MINFASCIEWIFDGIGTEIFVSIVSLIVGAFGGGLVGYRIGIKNKIKQKQKATSNAKQNQVGAINIVPLNNEAKDE